MKMLLILSLICSTDYLHISYPSQEHQEINNFIIEAKEEFLSEYNPGNELYITFKEYKSSFESYLFYVMTDFQGAHPLTHLKTFNFYENTYINLDDLLTEEDYYYFSKEAEKVLIPELKKEEMFIEDMFYEGIKPIKANYKNIIISEDHFLVFFEHYQVAPYAAGIRSIEVKRWDLYG